MIKFTARPKVADIQTQLYQEQGFKVHSIERVTRQGVEMRTVRVRREAKS
jgi:hypothetical protein